jgi:hypothetical protein
MEYRRDNEGFIWDGFAQKYPKSLTNSHDWIQGYRDGAICTRHCIKRTFQKYLISIITVTDSSIFW